MISNNNEHPLAVALTNLHPKWDVRINQVNSIYTGGLNTQVIVEMETCLGNVYADVLGMSSGGHRHWIDMEGTEFEIKSLLLKGYRSLQAHKELEDTYAKIEEHHCPNKNTSTESISTDGQGKGGD